jgi:hypothetical protein
MCAHYRHPNEVALKRANENVQKHFAVVGLTEDMFTFTKVLEHVIPSYFRGMSDLYKEKEGK